MKNRLLFFVCAAFVALNACAAIVFRDQFDAVDSGQIAGDGEYLVAADIIGTANSNVYGGSIIGFTTNNFWYGTNNLVAPVEEGLEYSSATSTLVVAGGRLSIDLTDKDDSVREVVREIDDVQAGNTWYFSALLRATADSDGTAVIRFDDADGLAPGFSPYVFGIGFGFEDGNIVLLTRKDNSSRESHVVMSNYVADTTYMIVVKGDLDTNVSYQYSDTISVWVNPVDLKSDFAAGEPDFVIDVNTLTSSVMLVIDEFRIFTSGFGDGVVDVDEVHVGRSWWDVVNSVSESALIVYDDFQTGGQYQYQVDQQLLDQNPIRTGFVDAWRNSSSSYWQPYSENLGYTNRAHALVTSGGSAQVDMPTHYDRYIYRSTENISDNVLYISSLMSFELNGEDNDYAYAGLMDRGDTAYYAGVRWGVVAGKAGVICRKDSNQNQKEFVVGDGSYIVGQPNLFVIKMEKNIQDYWDRVTVYLNPDDLSSESSNTVDFTELVANLVGSTVLDEIVMKSHGVSNGVFKVDEIRVGTTWEEVLPYETVEYYDPGTVILIN